MRIDSTTPTLSVVAGESRDTRAAAKPATSEASVVRLSSAGVAVSNSSTSEDHVTAKVSHIRALLAKGEYPVDLDQLASRIVDDELVRSRSK